MKEAKKLAKLRKIKDKSEILIENTSFLFEDESIESSWISENHLLYYKDFDWEKDSNFEDNLEITDNIKDVLDINIFIKLLRVVQNSINFENYKILFLHGPYFSTQQKKRHI